MPAVFIFDLTNICKPRVECTDMAFVGRTTALQNENKFWAIRIGTFCLVLIFLASVASAKRLPVKRFTSADGLGSSFVDSIYRDSRGFM